MKRKIFLFLIVFVLVVLLGTLFVSCKTSQKTVKMPTLCEVINNFESISIDNREKYVIALEDGYTFSKAYRNGAIELQYQSADMSYALYGVINEKEEIIVPFSYLLLYEEGGYIWGIRDRKDTSVGAKIADVFNCSGNLLISLEYKDDGFLLDAINDEYFSIIDKNQYLNILYRVVNGKAEKQLFALTRVSSNDRIIPCGDYLLLYDKENGDYEILTSDGWSPSANSPDSSIFTTETNGYYKVSYMDGKFLVAHTYPAGMSDYTYVKDGAHYKCELYFYEPETAKRTDLKLPYPVYDLENVYDAKLSYFATQNYYLKSGYTYAFARVLNEDKEPTGIIRYYIIDNDGNVVFETEDFNLKQLRYVDGLGVITSSANSFGYLTNENCLILDGSGETVWSGEGKYFNAYYNDGAYVLYDKANRAYSVFNTETKALSVENGYIGMSPFVDGYAIGYKNDSYYRISREGKATLLNYDFAQYAYANYYLELNSSNRIISFSGKVLVGEYQQLMCYHSDSYSSFVFVTSNNDENQTIHILKRTHNEG